MTGGLVSMLPQSLPPPARRTDSRPPPEQAPAFGSLLEGTAKQPSSPPRPAERAVGGDPAGKPEREEPAEEEKDEKTDMPAALPLWAAAGLSPFARPAEPVPSGRAADGTTGEPEGGGAPQGDGAKAETAAGLLAGKAASLRPHPPSRQQPRQQGAPVQDKAAQDRPMQDRPMQNGLVQDRLAQAEAGLRTLDPGLQALTTSLRQGFRAGGRLPGEGHIAEAADVKTGAEPAPESGVAPNRGLRAAAASLGLFGEGRRSQAAAGRTAGAGVDAPKGTRDRTTRSAEADKAEKGAAAPAVPDPKAAAALLALPGADALQAGVTPKAFADFIAARIEAAAVQAPIAGAVGERSPAARLQALEVRLHPAELGSVTAKLRITDQQLSVEIVADSADGRDSLSVQEGAIRAALEALGFRIDRLTILHLPGPAGTAQGAGPSDQPPGQGPGGMGDAGGKGQGAGHGKGGGGSAERLGGLGEMAPARPPGGSGVFI